MITHYTYGLGHFFGGLLFAYMTQFTHMTMISMTRTVNIYMMIVITYSLSAAKKANSLTRVEFHGNNDL